MPDETYRGGINRRSFIAGAVALGMMAALPGCASNSSGTTANANSSANTASGTSSMLPETSSGTGGTLKYSILNPSCIEPYDCHERYGAQVVNCLFSPLTRYNYQQGRLECLAASSYEVDSTYREFTFHLWDDAVFHNGEKVTAAAFKHAWERIVSPLTNPGAPSSLSSYLSLVVGFDDCLAGTVSTIAGITALDETTLKIRLSSPFAEFPLVVSHPGLSPVPESVTPVGYDTFSLAPIGNGPFMMQGSWVKDGYIQMVRFDGYTYAKPALLDGVDFLIEADEDTAFVDFQAGNVDVCTIPLGHIAEASAAYGEAADGYTIKPGGQVLLGAEHAVDLLALNGSDGMVGKPEVRTAFAASIDRETLCKTVFEGAATPATGIVPPGVGGYQEAAWPKLSYSTSVASESLSVTTLLSDDPLPSSSLSFDTAAGLESVVQVLQTDFSASGITTSLNAVKHDEYLAAIANRGYSSGYLTWVAYYPSMDAILFPLFSSKAGANVTGYTDIDVDDAITTARAITAVDERDAAYQAIEKTVGDSLPVIPMGFCAHHYIGSASVNDLYIGPSCLADFRTAWLSS
jgi:oligopeptide transport system substrate-binding protein